MPNLARLPGLMEADVAWGSGMRRATHRLHCRTAQTQNVNARPIGGAASASVTTWTALTVNNRPAATLGTLVAQIVQASAVVGTVQLRVRGYNQFHEFVEEITPTVVLAAKTNNFVYLAQTFAHVVSVDFMSTGLDIAGDTISLGSRWDWTRTNDATNEHLFGRNLGIAVPMRLRGVQTQPLIGGASRVRQEYGLSVVAGDIDQQKVPASMQAAMRSASARLQCTVPPTSGDTVTIDGKVYTWRASITAADGDVQIGATAAQSLNALVAAMFASGGAGTLYGANTVAHPTVQPTGVGQVGGVENMFVAAKTGGVAGNLIAVSESGAATGWIDNNGQPAGNLGFGVDFPVEVLSLAAFDVTGQALAGALTLLQPTEFACGMNEFGWLGERSKVHILRQSSVAQWAAADNVMVSMTVLSAEHG